MPKPKKLATVTRTPRARGLRSRNKGKGGEREAVKLLVSLGFSDARRTQQRRGDGVGDVECPATLPKLHIEVKRFGKYAQRKLAAACLQAQRDSQGAPFCIFWRPDKGEWRLSLWNGVCIKTVSDSGRFAGVLRSLIRE